MNRTKVVSIDSIFPNLEPERSILNPIGVDLVEKRCVSLEEVISLTKGARAMMTTVFKPIGEDVFKACPTLKLVVRTGIGVDTIDVSAATRYGVTVCNVPDYCLEEVSDHAVALLLALARKITISNERMKKGEFSYEYLKPIYDLRHKTVGFLGFGRIAQLVAKKLLPFNMNMVFFDPHIEDPAVNGVVKCSMEDTLRKSDYLTVHLPQTTETHHLLNDRTLGMLKNSAYLINTSRGGVIDTDALIRCLETKSLAGAALDVLENESSITADHPLCKMENVVLTPHSAWYSEDSLRQLQINSAMEVARFIKGERLNSIINPEVLKG
jgi:D-3-phosphoglycerate dehydrogenase / 2-oxoglutarate reductase